MVAIDRPAEQILPSRRTTVQQGPRVTITPELNLRLNYAARQVLCHPQRVTYLINRRTRMVCLIPVEPSLCRPGGIGYGVHPETGETTARAFLLWHGSAPLRQPLSFTGKWCEEHGGLRFGPIPQYSVGCAEGGDDD